VYSVEKNNSEAVFFDKVFRILCYLMAVQKQKQIEIQRFIVKEKIFTETQLRYGFFLYFCTLKQ
jgi:hypothetical protein